MVSSSLAVDQVTPSSDVESLSRERMPVGDDVKPVHLSASPTTSQTTQLQSQSLNSDMESVSVPSNSQVVNT